MGESEEKREKDIMISDESPVVRSSLAGGSFRREENIMIIAIAAIVAAIAVMVVAMLTFGFAAAAICGVFTAITVAIMKIFIMPKFEKRDKLRLETDNVRLTPERLEVRFDNLKNGYVIDCLYTSPDTGKKFVFTTQPYQQDPTPYLAEAKIAVVTNRVDYSNYYVDIRGLERLGGGTNGLYLN